MSAGKRGRKQPHSVVLTFLATKNKGKSCSDLLLGECKSFWDTCFEDENFIRFQRQPSKSILSSCRCLVICGDFKHSLHWSCPGFSPATQFIPAGSPACECTTYLMFLFTNKVDATLWDCLCPLSSPLCVSLLLGVKKWLQPREILFLKRLW